MTAEGTESDKKWYVLRVYTGQESDAKAYLEQEIEHFGLQDQIGEVLIPTETVIEMRDGKKRVKNKVFFPGYILIEMLLTPETQHLVTNAQGVMSYAGSHDHPIPLRPDEVDRILGRVAEKRGQITVDIPFQIEDKVKITDGPFKEFVGSIKEINHEKRKLKVLVSIFGRSTPVEVDFLQVTTNITQ